MIEASPPSYVIRCDICGRSDRSEFPTPPPGFVAIVAHPRGGVMTETHACLTVCVVRAAMRLSGAPGVGP